MRFANTLVDTVRLPPVALTLVLLTPLLFLGCIPRESGATPESPNAESARTAAEAASRELTLFAASSLTDVMDAMGAAFSEAFPEVRVVTNYASSSRLAIQLTEGAPAELFASANPRQMERVVESGRIDPEEVITFAHNTLVAIAPAAGDEGGAAAPDPAGLSEFADIAEPGLSLVLASPAVPVREYTDEMIDAAAAELGGEFRERFYGNLLSEESNVRQVAARIALGEADLGVVYATDVTQDIREAVRIIEIPSAYGVSASYLIAPVENGAEPAAARRFIAFVLAPRGREILEEHNFALPEKES